MKGVRTMKLSGEHGEYWKNKEIIYHPVGIIHSGHTEQENTPIQGIFNPSVGYVEVFPEFTEGLRDIGAFTHIYLIYHFHRATGRDLIKKPFLDGETERGIFAIRHFNRPNPIGLSIVGLSRVCGNILEITGVDILDGTPLLDIKPYVPAFDASEDIRTGWLEEARRDVKDRKADDRFG
jgi:tRNA-Thr(GGU) m(6)t(6)A37 methyltransferase TsaA